MHRFIRRFPVLPRARHARAFVCLALFASIRAHADAGPQAMPPQVLSRVDAAYPVAELQARTEAVVQLLVTVDANGAVSQSEVAVSGGPAFDAAALEAMAQWRFAPAIRDGRSVASRIRIPFTFALPPSARAAAVATPLEGDAGLLGELGSTRTEDAGIIGASLAITGGEAPIEVTVRGAPPPKSRGVSDFQLELGGLANVPRMNAGEVLKLAPGIFLSNEGGEAHAQQVFLRGFDAREGQDIEFSLDGVPLNESGNIHGNGYTDTHFIIPELIDSLRVIEGPYDPRQGNYAVAGSAEYHLALTQRGITAKAGFGNYGTYRQLLTYGPPGASAGTFAAAALYQTAGYGQNRDGRSFSFIGQFEGLVRDSTTLRATATAYVASFHSAGVLREDSYNAGKVGFYDTLDSLQGEDASRYSASLEVFHRDEPFSTRHQVFVTYRTLRIRENFTGFLLDVQEPLQSPHAQRGDLIDSHFSAVTFGAKGNARLEGRIFGQTQAIEIGYLARGDVTSGMQQRDEAATGHPYHTEANLNSILGDFALYLDAELKIWRYFALRGGVRTDLVTFDLNNLCAVQSVENPSTTNPPGDASCYSQQTFGAYREPNQRSGTNSIAVMPRGTLVLGPWHGVSASASVGKGIRTIDPAYVAQDVATPFATVFSAEGGIAYEARLHANAAFAARTVVFNTQVERDLIFSQTTGRNELAGPTTRLGSATSVRVRGSIYDVQANFTYVRATFDGEGLLIPYVPDVVFRFDGSLFGELPWWRSSLRGHALRGAVSAGLSVVGPRPLPYGARSDTIALLDASATLGWWLFEIGLTMQNVVGTAYRLGEFNYASDFRTQAYPTLVPVRHFSAGTPRMLMFTVAVNFGDGR